MYITVCTDAVNVQLNTNMYIKSYSSYFNFSKKSLSKKQIEIVYVFVAAIKLTCCIST